MDFRQNSRRILQITFCISIGILSNCFDLSFNLIPCKINPFARRYLYKLPINNKINEIILIYFRRSNNYMVHHEVSICFRDTMTISVERKTDLLEIYINLWTSGCPKLISKSTCQPICSYRYIVTLWCTLYSLNCAFYHTAAQSSSVS